MLFSRLPFLRCIAATALLWLAGSAFAQSAPCLDAAEASHQTLLGHWRAEFTPAADAPPAQTTTARLELTPHPELAASVRGRIQRASGEAQVAGDVDQGDFTLEESVNGTNISATWIGQVVSDSCGKEIRGLWTQENPPLARSFVLRKQSVE